MRSSLISVHTVWYISFENTTRRRKKNKKKQTTLATNNTENDVVLSVLDSGYSKD